MGLLNNTSDNDLLKSTVKEIAKAKNEIKCAQGDIKKAEGRLNYLIVLVNELLDRQNTDKQEETNANIKTSRKTKTY